MSTPISISARARAGVIAAVLTALTLSFASPSAAQIGAPVITSPAADSVTKSPFVVRGTAQADATVEVFADAVSLGTAGVASDGAWALTASLADGTHAVHAIASDGLTTSAPSDVVTFDVDSARPSVDITSPQADHVFTAGEPVEIEGTASDARALFRVRLEYWTLGKMERAVLADCADCAAGASAATWSDSQPIGAGDWLVKAFAVDQAGNYSLQDTVRFVNAGGNLPFSLPELPELPEEISPPEITSPEFGSIEPGAGQPIEIGGTSDRNVIVEVYEEVDGLGQVGGGVETENDGSWKVTVRLPDGKYGFRARSIDEHGNVSDLSELLEFTVDGHRPVPQILTASNTIFLPTEPVVLEGTVTDNREAALIVVEYYDHRGKLVLRDQAECDGCPGASATWRHEPSLPFGPGVYTAKVYAYDVAGNGSHIHQLSFTKTL